MEIRYSLTQHTVPFWTPPEMVYNARILGYDTVGIRGIRQQISGEGTWDLVRDRGLRQAARRAMEETGIPIHDMDLAMIAADRRVEAYKPALEAAAELGIRGIISSIWTDDASFYLEEFSRLCDLAADYQMVVHLEYVAWASVSTFCQAKGILEIAGKPNAKILVDTLHQFCSGKDADILGTVPESWLELVHLCDAPKGILDSREEQMAWGRTQRLYPGEGDADLAGVLRRLTGPVVCGLEIPHRRRLFRLGAFEYAKRCLQETKEWFREKQMGSGSTPESL